MKALADVPVEIPSGHRLGPRTCDAITCAAIQAESDQPVLAQAQQRWAARPIAERVSVLRGARHWMAARAAALASALSPDLQRSQAETLVAEVLPLLDAIRFLERRARGLLAPRRLGRRGRPLWLGGMQAEIHREALGHVLVIAPANFPLFLPGVQTMQALVAGNAVTWKPGAGGSRVATLVAHALHEAGLPRAVLCVTDETVEATQSALAQRPDKVVFTGSVGSGRSVLHELAKTATPSVMELSGADAVIVLPSANLAAAAKAIAFGLRLNGAEVCMSPRRLVATAATLRSLRPLLESELAGIPPTRLKPRTATFLRDLVAEAVAEGAQIMGDIEPEAQHPLLIADARSGMRIAQSDLFAPVLCLLQAESVLHIADLVNECPYALSAAVFGAEHQARALGAQLRVGTLLVNDVIAPTADPRVPFGGRGQSGFGVTRGAEGLLEMTAIKTFLLRKKVSTLHYQPIGSREVSLFAALIGTLHGGSLHSRVTSLKAAVVAGRSR